MDDQINLEKSILIGNKGRFEPNLLVQTIIGLLVKGLSMDHIQPF
jgi:hypothetical protein